MKPAMRNPNEDPTAESLRVAGDNPHAEVRSVSESNPTETPESSRTPKVERTWDISDWFKIS